MRIVLLLLLVVASLATRPASTSLQAQSGASALDYEYFKTKVQPIFSAVRPGYARCVSCHMYGTPMQLAAMSPGATTWNEEQTKRNFQLVSARVRPREIRHSILLLNPLASAVGGTFYHSGGKHWGSFYNPEWQTIANWACGVKAGEKEWKITGFACPEAMHQGQH